MKLASIPGENYNKVRGMLLRSWQADSSNFESTMMKHIVNEIFSNLTNRIPVYDEYGWNISNEFISHYSPVVQWMYEETQRDLVGRGFVQKRAMHRFIDKSQILIQPLMSYTDRKDKAEAIAKQRKIDGILTGEYDILPARFEPERIFMWYGGPGWLSSHEELEYIIICGKDLES